MNHVRVHVHVLFVDRLTAIRCGPSTDWTHGHGSGVDCYVLRRNEARERIDCVHDEKQEGRNRNWMAGLGRELHVSIAWHDEVLDGQAFHPSSCPLSLASCSMRSVYPTCLILVDESESMK